MKPCSALRGGRIFPKPPSFCHLHQKARQMGRITACVSSRPIANCPLPDTRPSALAMRGCKRVACRSGRIASCKKVVSAWCKSSARARALPSPPRRYNAARWMPLNLRPFLPRSKLKRTKSLPPSIYTMARIGWVCYWIIPIPFWR